MSKYTNRSASRSRSKSMSTNRSKSMNTSVILLQLLEYKCIPTGIKENPHWREVGAKEEKEVKGKL